MDLMNKDYTITLIFKQKTVKFLTALFPRTRRHRFDVYVKYD